MPGCPGGDMSDFLFHRVLAMYKLSVIFLQLGLRYRIRCHAGAALRAADRRSAPAFWNSPTKSPKDAHSDAIFP